MTDIKTEIDDKEYYYVNFRIYPATGAAIDAVIVLPQNKIEGGGKNPDGFGFLEATEYLFNMYHVPILIHAWRQVTQTRFLQFQTFLEKVVGDQPGEKKPRATHLTLVSKAPTP